MKHARSGSALLIILCFLGIIGALTQQLVKTSFLTIRLLSDEIKRTKAQILAQNGLTLAMAQLTQQLETKKNLPDSNPKVEALEKVLSILNRWQSFPLTKDLDGMQGTIKIYVACEDGKIPLQNIIDPATKKVLKPIQELFKNLYPGTDKKPKDPTTALAAFLSKKDAPLEDVTQVLPFFDLPLAAERPNPKSKTVSQQPALLDLFSVWNTSGKINPLFFSRSLGTTLKLKAPGTATKDDKDQKELYHRIAEAVSKEWGSDWDKNWSVLTPLYGAKPQMPAETTSLFSEAVEPALFSVVSCGIIQGVEQRLYAVIHKRKKAPQPEAQQKTSENNQPEGSTFAKPDAVCGIMRMYWIDQFNTYEEH